MVAGKRELRDLGVKCENVERNCEWQGTVHMLEEHVSTCQYTLLPCPKECKDDGNQTNRFMRKDLDDHLEKDCMNRQYECDSCGEVDTYDKITRAHDKICALKVIQCPNDDCTQQMRRKKMKWHLELCPETEIPCKYRRLGCEVTMKRKAMPEHEQNNDTIHLQIAMEREDSKQEQEVTLGHGKAMTFKVMEYQKKKDQNEIFTSSPFYSHQRGYHMVMEVTANKSGSLSVYVRAVKGKYDAELVWPCTRTAHITLLNQLEDRNHISRSCQLDVTIGKSYGYPEFASHSDVTRNQNSTQFLKDDTLYFKVSIDHKPWLDCTPTTT